MATTNRNPPRSSSEPAKPARPAQEAPPAQPQQDIPQAGAGNLAPATTGKPAADKPKRSLSEAISARGIDEFQWRTLCDSLFPGAQPESILMAVDYCKARHLDVLKKPCHIVNMEVAVKNRSTGQTDYVYRDVVLPGIYEYRTTAMRTGLYLGHDEPECGEWEEQFGVNAPRWCKFVVYRWNEIAKQKVAFPVIVYFDEVVATKRDGSANRRWTKAPYQMLCKCAEAAALRAAFPDELGGEPTFEEMEDRHIVPEQDVTPTAGASRADLATEALRRQSGQADNSDTKWSEHPKRMLEKVKGPDFVAGLQKGQDAEHTANDREEEINRLRQSQTAVTSAHVGDATPEKGSAETSEGPTGKVGSYTTASAIDALKQARTPKALKAIWELIADDFVFTDRPMPTEVEVAYNKRVDELDPN